MSLRSRIAQWQGFYYVATGLWGLFDLDSFEWATGAKTDDWLVRTVAVLVVAIGTSLIVSARRAPGPESQVLGQGCALGLFGIDCFFVWRDVISPMYLVDAVLEALFILAWAVPKRPRFRVGILRRAAPHWRGHESR